MTPPSSTTQGATAARRHCRQAGIALMVVMVSIAVLSILAATFAYQMKVETRLAQNASAEMDLVYAALSGVQKARYILALQMTLAQEPFDSLNQKWAGGPGSLAVSNSPLADISFEEEVVGGYFRITKIVDLERKFNINTADEPMLQRALQLIGVDAGDFPAIIGSILDWIDPDDAEHIGGTESDYYQGLTPPYFAKNGPIDDISELLLIRNVWPEVYSTEYAPREEMTAAAQAARRMGLVGAQIPYQVGLVDLFSPFSAGRININTASVLQLQMLPYVDEAIAAEIVRFRAGPDGMDGSEDDTPFRNPGELVNVGLNNQVVGQIQRLADVRSRTFEVTVEAEVAGYKKTFVAIVGRNNPRDLPILSFYSK